MQKPNLNRRTFLQTGILASIVSFFEGVKSFTFSKKTEVADAAGKAALVEDFLNESCDAENYRRALTLTKMEVVTNVREKYADQLDQVEAMLSDEYWKQQADNITAGVRKDIDEKLTAEDLRASLDFFRSEAGQNYLKWKSTVQSRSSNTFKAIRERQRTHTAIMQTLNNNRGEKSKLS